jgi:hypothetical protein
VARLCDLHSTAVGLVSDVAPSLELLGALDVELMSTGPWS